MAIIYYGQHVNDEPEGCMRMTSPEMQKIFTAKQLVVLRQGGIVTKKTDGTRCKYWGTWRANRIEKRAIKTQLKKTGTAGLQAELLSRQIPE